ncbi:MAG: hypothetical protein JXA96_17170 [Sedimentisphaerales bacterium]|nr:hypothetical protein [Sedimentisphaerales bacterium]
MNKALRRGKNEVFYYKDNEEIKGIHADLGGDMSGIRGDVSGIYGDLDMCKITDEERKAGILIKDLVID